MTHPTPASRPELRRELGKWDLTAIGVNQVIGAAIFATPGTLAAQVGGWSWIGVIAVGLLTMLIALNFAEASSRFDRTGGAYLYTRAAFGRFPGFQVGWMLFITRATSWASVINALADALGYYWPELRAGFPRMALITGVIAAITIVNVRGVRQSANVVNFLTVAKLAPLAVFVALGLPHISGGALRPEESLTLGEASTTALLLIFAFGGYEVIPVPAGETRNPTRDVPFAMIATIVIVIVIMTLVQVVALGTLPTLGASKTPLADASALFIGAWGALLMTAGAAISMTGNNVGQALSGSRNLFALSEQGDLPAVFAHVHPKFRTPDFAIAFISALALALALLSDFRSLAAVSAVARLLVYVGTCSSVLALRRHGPPAPFTIPLGPVIPIVAILISIALLYGATALQLRVGAAFLVAGAVLYAIARWRKT
jgi:basic amino acid/polyamine antiporter, APA family